MLIHKNNNFIGLLIGLLVLIFTTPLLHLFDEKIAQFILHLAIIGMMIITIIGNQGNRQWYRSIIILSIIEVIIFLLAILLNEMLLTHIAISLLLIFLITSIAVAFSSVFFSQEITINQLVGASCIYLLLGIVWAILYTNLYYFDVESFKGLGGMSAKMRFQDFMYFSFVTLSTLGYGDITPVTQFAKTLAFMQAVVGQLYLTIMVAGLVGKAINSRSPSTSD
ncbi:Potassium channel protein [hydrothermal vent metagenome]|uniref:Potassium channel protein n=1 Tax=hydrothermal vent metagenome TaxID=652676 RepID=A0A3B0XNA0_9ZZZZ